MTDNAGYKITRLGLFDRQQTVNMLSACFGEECRPLIQSDLGSCNDQARIAAPIAYVAKRDREVLGAVMSTDCMIAFNTRGFSWLGVREGERRHGVATALMRHAEDDAAARIFKGEDCAFIINVFNPDVGLGLGYEAGGLTNAQGHAFMVKKHIHAR